MEKPDRHRKRRQLPAEAREKKMRHGDAVPDQQLAPARGFQKHNNYFCDDTDEELIEDAYGVC